MTKNTIAIGVAISLMTFIHAAEAEQRQLGAHEHGHGKLNIAVEDKRVQMELEVPGADIVGFEHMATTPEEKAQVAQAEEQLKDALKQFVLPAAASCTLVKVDLGIDTGGDEEHVHEHEHEHENIGRKGDHKEDAHEGEVRHTEFHATYALDCASPEQIKMIHFAYFKSFPNARSLSVNIVSETQQGSYEVTANKPDIDLSGSM